MLQAAGARCGQGDGCRIHRAPLPHTPASRYPALIGSIAVASGYFLHIDALGNMHWNAHDAMLGLQCALPIMAVDAALMLPDYRWVC